MFKSSISNRPDYSFHREYLWTDYLELLALTEPEGIIMLSDLKDRLNEELTEVNSEIEPIDDSLFNGLDKFERRYIAYFNHFKSRSRLYQEAYPFTVEADCLIRKPQLSESNLAYAYLLCCSNNKYLENGAKATLTSDFELISAAFLKSIKQMSHGPYVFGKNSTNCPSRYTGPLSSKVSALAEDMGHIDHVQNGTFAPTNTGDGGVDLIGWDNPWDSTNSQFVYLGNCKCSEDWQETRNPSECLKGWFALNNGAINL